MLIVRFSKKICLSTTTRVANSATLVRRSVLVTNCTTLTNVSLAFIVVFQLGFTFRLGAKFLVYNATVVVTGLVYVRAHGIPLLIKAYFVTKFFHV